LEVVELVYMPQYKDKCRIIVKSAEEIFFKATTKIKKANENKISI